MREIKFRAWDSEGFMHDSSDLDASEDYFVAFDSGVMHLYHVNTVGDYTKLKIMQYTGLKDKNGIEIYEGDIISGYFRGIGTDVGRVRFKEGAFIVKVLGLDALDSLYEWKRISDRLEVVGNIYETPELLGGETE